MKILKIELKEKTTNNKYVIEWEINNKNDKQNEKIHTRVVIKNHVLLIILII